LALKNAGLKASDIDAIITVSTTGISAPSLENFLMDKMEFSPRVERTPIWGWGCAGGVLGLKRAAQLAQANGGQRVLLLVVELCTLSFRQGSENPKDIIASALFGDGAAAAVVEPSSQGWAIEHSMEHRWPDSTSVMGWDVADDGLSVVFSKKIPEIVENDFPVLYQDFLRNHSLSRSELDYFIAHPGGAKILDALEKIYDLPEGGLEDSRATLNDYGNMSSVTVLMVLERFLNRKSKSNLSGRRLLLSTFGPGFTSALMTLKKNTETL
jgi:alkylresorcinol/alkylpyrone synthase